jgi:hypothetical protein
VKREGLSATGIAFHASLCTLLFASRFVVVTTGKRRFAALLYAPWHFALTLYTADELAGMLREAGFVAVEAYSLDAEDLIGYGIKV